MFFTKPWSHESWRGIQATTPYCSCSRAATWLKGAGSARFLNLRLPEKHKRCDFSHTTKTISFHFVLSLLANSLKIHCWPIPSIDSVDPQSSLAHEPSVLRTPAVARSCRVYGFTDLVHLEVFDFQDPCGLSHLHIPLVGSSCPGGGAAWCQER